MFSDTILYEEQFVDENDQIYVVNSSDKVEVCLVHDKMLGVVQVHMKDDEGCIIEIYEANRCTKCGMVWKGEMIYKARKIPCPH